MILSVENAVELLSKWRMDSLVSGIFKSAGGVFKTPSGVVYDVSEKGLAIGDPHEKGAARAWELHFHFLPGTKFDDSTSADASPRTHPFSYAQVRSVLTIQNHQGQLILYELKPPSA